MTTGQASSGGGAARSRLRGPAAAFGIYLLVSFLFFGDRVVAHLGSRTIGISEDPPVSIWSLKWWPQSVLEGWNPLHIQVVYPPHGFDTAWMTAIPGPSLVLAPLTQTAGPIVAFNVLAFLIPALNGWAAFLLCRSLGARYWPSVIGGYLFGFSSYVIAQTLGHPSLALVACIPLAFYLVVRRLGGALSRRAFVAALTATLTFEFLTSTEVFLTLAMFGVLILLLALAALPDRREAIWSAARLVLLAYVFTGVLVSPYLVSALSTPNTLDIYSYSTDPLNLLIPTKMTAVGGGALESVSARFNGDLIEQGSYLGLPLLLIALLFWRERRDRFAAILVIAMLVVLIATLGPRLNVLDSASWLRLPWAPLAHLPLFEYVIPIRLIVYVWLLLAIMVALWLSMGGRGRWALGALAIAFVFPNPFVTLRGTKQQSLAGAEQSPWSWPRSVPRFFRSPQQRAVLDHHGTVLVLPYHYFGDSMLWQAEANMSFRMAGGYVSATIPDDYRCWPIFQSLAAGVYRADQRSDLIAFLRSKGVGAVLAPENYVATASPLLRALPGERRDLGGMRVYLLPKEFTAAAAPTCPSAR
jgi:hypothetical protein